MSDSALMTEISSEEAAELYEAGNYAEAEVVFRRMLDEEPENTQALLLLGLCRSAQSDLKMGIEFVREAAEIEPSNAYYQSVLGSLLLEAKNPEAAREALEKSVSLNPNQARARALLGFVHFMANEFDKAISTLKTALKAQPDEITALSTLVLALLAKGEIEQAHAFANRSIVVAPEDPRSQSVLGQVFLAQGHHAFAEQCLRNALQNHTANAELNSVLADVLAAQNRNDEAAYYYAKAMQSGYGGLKTSLKLTRTLSKTRRRDQAIEMLEEKLKLFPNQEEITLQLAEIYLEQGDYGSIEPLIEKLESSDPRTRLLQTRLFIETGQIDQAQDLVGGLIQHEDPAVNVPARNLAARLAIAQRNPKAGAAVIEPVLGHSAVDFGLIGLLAQMSAQQDQRELAKSLLSTALKNRSAVGNVRSRLNQLLASLLDQEANYAEAAKYLADAGSRPAPIMRQLVVEANQENRAAWLAMKALEWREEAPADDLADPIIILGWPGSGRAPLIDALSTHERIQRLDADQGQMRADSLQLRSSPSELAELSQEQIKAGRAAFSMHSLNSNHSELIPLETVWWENSSLPALARFFPSARVIVPETDIRDLELMWRLAGFADIQHLLDLWNSEQSLLEHVQKMLNLDFLKVSRSALMSDPEQAMAALCRQLSIKFEPTMARVLRNSFREQEIRPEGHWGHFASVLITAASND